MIKGNAQQTILGITFYPRQWEAVTSPIGPVLVLAGPGAGKTRCLTGRIGYLVDRCHVDPRSICAITFTNKAAREMHHRLRGTLGDRVEELSSGTIHSLCLGLLRDHSEEAGLGRGFGVADETHQRLILKKLGIPPTRQGGVLTRFGRHSLEGYRLVEGERLTHEKYTEILESQNLVDFNGLLHRLKCLLDSEAGVLELLQKRWDHLLIDEFQDLDPVQYAIVRHLGRGHRSLFAVGDDDQSIFSFRSADPRLIHSLMRDFDIRSPIVLDVNCRCARPIFDVARKILPPDQFGFDKQIAALRESDSQVRIMEFDHDGDETSWIVADLIKDQRASGLPWGEFALLYRYHSIGEKFEQELIAAGVPCQMGKGRALTDDPMIEQLLCALRLILNPGSWLEIERMARAILGELLLTEVQQLSGDTLLAQAREFAASNRNEDGKRCWKLVYLVENLRGLGARETQLGNLISAIMDQGIGRGETPLEANFQELSDPNDFAPVKRLGDLFIRAERERSSILITQAHGLEYPIREMIRRALPALRVEIWAPREAMAPNSLLLLLGEDGPQLSHLGEAICH